MHEGNTEEEKKGYVVPLISWEIGGPHLFYSRQIFKYDVNGFSSTSDICFIVSW
jgi:hypothetical protein